MEIRAVPFCPPPPPAPAPAEAPLPTDTFVPIRILHMNDIHGAVEDLASASTVLQRERAAHPGGAITLNAGDLAEGSMVAYLSKGEAVVAALNPMGFDAIELGNHDFIWGQQVLGTMLQGLDAPVLGANVVHTEDERPLTRPYVVREENGVKVGVIGVDTPDMERFVGAEKLAGLRFEDPQQAVRRWLPEVRQQGAEVVVVLSHLGFDEDRKLAQAVPGIDVIVGGHSHTELPQGHHEGGTLIVQAGANGHFVGEVDLRYDRAARRVVASEARLLSASAAPDPAVQTIVEKYQQRVAAQAGRVMGQAATALRYSHDEAAMLNQMNADSLLKASGAEIAVCSSRNLRGNLEAGDVTYRDLFAAYPMTEEDAVVMRATGRMLLAEIEDRVADGGRGVLVPAGLRYTYDRTLPSGHRVTGVTLADGRALDPDREYTVATTITTARKKTFAAARDLRRIGSSQEIFMAYFKQGSPWRDAPDDRVATPPAAASTPPSAPPPGPAPAAPG